MFQTIFRLMTFSSFALHQSRSFQLIHSTRSCRSFIHTNTSAQQRYSNICNKSFINQINKPRNQFIQRMSTNTESTDVDVASNLKYVQDSINKCVQDCNRSEGSVNLIAVSKTKPNELLMDAYNVSDINNVIYFICPIRRFVQELISPFLCKLLHFFRLDNVVLVKTMHKN